MVVVGLSGKETRFCFDKTARIGSAAYFSGNPKAGQQSPSLAVP